MWAPSGGKKYGLRLDRKCRGSGLRLTNVRRSVKVCVQKKSDKVGGRQRGTDEEFWGCQILKIKNRRDSL